MNDYVCYKNLGGVVDVKDYESAFLRVKLNPEVREVSVDHAKLIADYAGITTDKTTLRLYAVLRKDVAEPDYSGYHYSQMSDQRLFAEILLMAGDLTSFARMKDAYRHISFCAN